MRDINVVAKKMPRNGLKLANSLGCAFHFESEFKIELIKQKKDGFFAYKVKDCNYRSPQKCIVKRHLEKMHQKENIIMNNSTFIDDPKPKKTKFLEREENFDENYYFDITMRLKEQIYQVTSS